MFKWFLLTIAPQFLKIFAHVRWHGFENLDVGGTPVIIAPNHLGRLDALMPLMRKEVAHHPNLVAVVAEKYEKNPFYRFLVHHVDWMFIDRYNPDLRTMREVIRRMEKNGILPIAPEGTRSETGELLQGRPGAAYIAAKTGALIFPAAVIGTDDEIALPRLKRLQRADVDIWLGKPFRIPELPKTGRDEFLQKWTDELMCRIAILLPEERWGFYKDHPRLKELLKEKELAV
jgi:1-acyl-sn-glycerol-3-phosphate acyltransferase